MVLEITTSLKLFYYLITENKARNEALICFDCDFNGTSNDI